MKREIKFRAWDKINNKWLSFDDGDPIQQDYDGYIANGYWSMFFDYDSTEVELMQFTGLTDKNGVEIYEGDICSNNYNTSKQVLRRVEFKDGQWLLIRIKGKSKLNKEINLFEFYKFNFEVIGNIYKNQEQWKN